MRILDRINYPSDLKSLSLQELETLSGEIREVIISTVNKNGGHLASALGVVELTVAMHYVFDAPKDKIIFDVGHQSYAHKILTGRKERFATLRQLGGENGFTRSSSSVYDTFIAGHSSTSLSVAAGLMRARALTNGDYNIISVIGDGALGGGMAHEALNDAGNIPGKQIIILNDNAMSINKSVGSVADYLARMHTKKWYVKLKMSFKRKLDRPKPKRQMTLRLLTNMKNGIKYAMQGGLPFDQYGIRYFGPVDGHSLPQLVRFFQLAKNCPDSVVIHTVTVKGCGYPIAEDDPNKYHGLSPDDEVSPDLTFSKQAGITLSGLADCDDKVVAVTAAMCSGTGLNQFAEKYPERFFDVGIAEGHAVTMCAAMASQGLKPYFAVYSTFLQRGFDQIIHDVCIEGRNVTFMVDRSGTVGPDGETHQGTLDISYLTLIPGLTVAAPADTRELDALIKWSAGYDSPLAIKYPRGGVTLDYPLEPVQLGKWQTIQAGTRTAVIASGADMVKNALAAAEGTGAAVINARFLKPLDTALLDLVRSMRLIIVEDNVLNGGLYSLMSTYYSSSGHSPKMVSLSVKDAYVPQGSKEQLYELNGLDAAAIRKLILNEA